MRALAPWLTAAVAMLVVVTLPRLPLGSDDDSSWGAVLGYAHQKNLQFGTDLAFTYGPLGFVTTPYQCPQAAGLRLLADLSISFVAAAGVCLLAWRSGRVWRWVVIGSFVLLAGNAEPRSELLLNLGLVTWGLFCLVAQGRRAVAGAMVLAGLSAVAILAKATFLFIAPLAVLLVAADFALREKPRMALGLIAGFGGAVLLGWVLLGQAPGHLYSFVAQSLAFSAGYAGAMQAKGFATLTWTALGMVLLVLVVIGLCLAQWPGLRERHAR